MGKRVCLLLLALVVGGAAHGQGSKADYERSRNLRRLYQGKVAGEAVEPNWFDLGRRFWYRVNLGEGKFEFIEVDAIKGTRTHAFDHSAVAQALAKAAGRDVNPQRLPFESIAMQSDDTIQFRAFGKRWTLDPKSSRVEEAKKPASQAPIENQSPGRRSRSGDSPDGKWSARVVNNNVVLRADKDSEFTLTKDGTSDDFYNGNFYWSPDSKRLVAMKSRRGDERKVNLIESSPRDQLQPKLITLTYPKPGDKLNVSRPHLFDIANRKEIVLKDDLFSNPWSNDRIRWSADSKEFTFLHNQRGHQLLRLIGVEAETGKCRVIIEETSKTFIDYAHKTFLHFVEGTDDVIWMSERDGWNHLYLYDCRTGSVKNQITKGKWVVRGVERVDDAKREVTFRLSGIDSDQDPYYVHFARIRFDGSDLIRLTEGDGTHELKFSPNREFIVDRYSRADQVPITELRRCADGKLVTTLERPDISRLTATGWKPPERFTAKGRDGKTDIYGLIFRPSNFDPNKKYPVIEDIYAGPQGSFVPKDFAAIRSQMEMAELGFIVVKIDGMGTSNRSKAFHDVCWKNIGDAGFPDRIAWMRAAASKYPQMDLTRVGIFGGSAGGQNALGGLLGHGDFYKVGVASCGCHDNRMDKVWWNELWMGYPVGQHYAAQSNVTNAHKLKGKLLLIVGELDRNVDPASTMQVVNALIKADKDFDLLVVPGGGHGIGGPYGMRRQQDFMVRHLHGVEPRREEERKQ